MKSRLLKDILVYIVSPILLFNVPIINNIEIAFQVSCAIAIAYSAFTRIKENRVNFTGLVIFLLVITFSLLKQNPDSNNIYFYSTCVFLSLALIIPLAKVFNKDISIIVTKDILKSLNKNSLSIIRLFKKKSILNEINRICSMIEANFILLSLLRIINIMMYNGGRNSYLNFIANCIGAIFTATIIYKIIKVVYKSTKLNINKSNNGPNNENNTKGKIINFNAFK